MIGLIYFLMHNPETSVNCFFWNPVNPALLHCAPGQYLCTQIPQIESIWSAMKYLKCVLDLGPEDNAILCIQYSVPSLSS